MPIYMKFEKIDGSVTAAGYEKWIELSSFQWGAGRAIGSAQRTASGREASEPSLSEITVTKQMDISSPKFFSESVASELNNKVSIEFTTTTKNDVERFLKYELEDVGLSGYSVSAGSEGIPTESLTLNYTKITETFTGMDPATKGTPETVGYDLTQMKTT